MATWPKKSQANQLGSACEGLDFCECLKQRPGLVGAGYRDLDHLGTAPGPDGANLFCRHLFLHFLLFDAKKRALVYLDRRGNRVVICTHKGQCQAAGALGLGQGSSWGLTAKYSF